MLSACNSSFPAHSSRGEWALSVTPRAVGTWGGQQGLCMSRPGPKQPWGKGVEGSSQPDNFLGVVKGAGAGLLLMEDGCAREISRLSEKWLQLAVVLAPALIQGS